VDPAVLHRPIADRHIVVARGVGAESPHAVRGIAAARRVSGESTETAARVVGSGDLDIPRKPEEHVLQRIRAVDEEIAAELVAAARHYTCRAKIAVAAASNGTLVVSRLSLRTPPVRRRSGLCLRSLP
jgi:hypothetical protein